MSKRRTVSVSEFKAKALELFAEIAVDGGSIEVTKRGRPIASVVPTGADIPKENLPGQLEGTLEFDGDVIGPLGEKLWSAAR